MDAAGSSRGGHHDDYHNFRFLNNAFGNLSLSDIHDSLNVSSRGMYVPNRGSHERDNLSFDMRGPTWIANDQYHSNAGGFSSSLTNDVSLVPSTSVHGDLWTSRRLIEMNQPPSTSPVSDKLYSYILSFARAQHGSHLLQTIMGGGDRHEIANIIFSVVINHIDDLIIHPSASNVVQKLVEVCNDEQKSLILRKLTTRELQFVSVCCDTYGNRTVKKLLDRITSPILKRMVISALVPGVVRLAKERNTVIEQCLQNFSHEDVRPLVVELVKNCYEIATDQNGCCMLQSCIKYATGANKECLLVETASYSLPLAQHQYGNYVVQGLLGLKIPRVWDGVLQQLHGSFLSLSANKYSSHVVEKCFDTLEQGRSMRIVMEMISSPAFPKLFTDAYGNYVIQKVLYVAQNWGSIFDYLEQLIQANRPQLESHIFGKNAVARLKDLQRRRNVVQPNVNLAI